MNWWIYNWSYLNRMLTADTIVPGPSDPQSFNRYSYVNNNPVRYNDPSGHSCNAPIDAPEVRKCRAEENDILQSTVLVRYTYTTRYMEAPGVFATSEEVINSHATVIDDETIVTHDHYPFSHDESSVRGAVSVELFSSNGTTITTRGPVDMWALSNSEGGVSETRIMKFASGTFTGLNFADQINDVAGLPQAGSEVGSITWDGTNAGSTGVQWSTVNSEESEIAGNLMVTTDTPNVGGASGGGYFYQGNMFANHYGSDHIGGSAFGATNPWLYTNNISVP